MPHTSKVIVIFTAFALIAGCATTGTSVPEAVPEPPVRQPETIDPAARGAAYYAFVLAQRAVYAGDLKTAGEMIDYAVRFDPDSALLRTYQARFLLNAGDVQRARETLAQALAIDPDYLPALDLQAGILVALGRSDEAVAVYEHAVELAPDRIDAYVYLADLLVGQKRFDRAGEVVDRMKERFPWSIETWLRAGQLGAATGDTAAAREAMRRVLAIELDNEEALLTLGFLHEADGELDEAITLYERHVRESPHSLRMRAHLVTLYLRTERYGDAERENEQLSLLGYEESQIFRNRGLIAAGRDDQPSAIEWFEKTLKLYPEDEIARYYLGTANLRLKHFERAQEAFDSIPADSDLRSDGDFGAALALRSLGRYDEARSAIEAALQADPENPDYMRLLALLHADVEEYDLAEDLLRKLIAEHPDDLEYVFALGAVYENSRAYTKGVRLMKKILRREPDNADAHNYIGYIYALMGEHFADAEKHLNRAIAAKPGDPFITDSLGWLYFRMGRHAEALEKLAEAADKLPDEPVVLRHLGEVHAALGHADRAREAFERALGCAYDDKMRAEIASQIEALEP